MQRYQLGDNRYNNECEPIYVVNRLLDQRFDLVTVDQIVFWWDKLGYSEQLWLWVRCRKQCESSNVRFHGLLTFGPELSFEDACALRVFEQNAQMTERQRSSQTLKVIKERKTHGTTED